METPIIYPSIYFDNKFIAFEEIIKMETLEERHCAKGGSLTKYGSINNHAYYIKSGIMHLSLAHSEGGEKSLALFGPGSIFPIGMTQHRFKAEYEMILRAFSDLHVYRFPYITLRNMVLRNPELGVALLEFDCAFIGYMFFDSVNQALESSMTRVCDILYLYYTDTPIAGCEIEISQTTLANIAGISRAQMERSIQKLRNENAIKTGRNKIQVVAIQKIMEHCSTAMRGKYRAGAATDQHQYHMRNRME